MAIVFKNHVISLSHVLNEIYYAVIIEESYYDDLDLLQGIIACVDKNNQIKKDVFLANPHTAFALDTNAQLVELFVNKYRSVLDKACTVAWKINAKFSYTIDIASVVAPYILYKLGVTSDCVAFYMGLGMVLANIVCDSLSNMKEEHMDKKSDFNNKEIYKAINVLLIEAKKNAKGKKAKAQIDKSLEHISKLQTEMAHVDD